MIKIIILLAVYYAIFELIDYKDQRDENSFWYYELTYYLGRYIFLPFSIFIAFWVV